MLYMSKSGGSSIVSSKSELRSFRGRRMGGDKDSEVSSSISIVNEKADGSALLSSFWGS